MPGEIISEHRARSNRNAGRHHRGFAGDFPRNPHKGKHDDQVDSTAQFLDWFKRPFPSQGLYEYYRQRAQELEQQRGP
jgi:hypothetical protein